MTGDNTKEAALRDPVAVLATALHEYLGDEHGQWNLCDDRAQALLANAQLRQALTLGLAWQAAEDALPEGGELYLSRDCDGTYEAEAAPRVKDERTTPWTWVGIPFQSQIASGATPAEALDNLRASLLRTIE